MPGKRLSKERIMGVESPSINRFPVGTRVRIRRDSEYAHQNSGIGTVLSQPAINSKWVRVQFDNGRRNAYRIGQNGGICDLELAGPTQLELFEE